MGKKEDFTYKCGHIISELRYKHKLTQEDLAVKLDVSKGAIGMWETNKRYPSTTNLIAMSYLFNISVDTLLGISLDSNNIATINKKMTEREENLLSTFRKLSIDDQDILIGDAKKMLKEQKSENSESFIKKAN